MGMALTCMRRHGAQGTPTRTLEAPPDGTQGCRAVGFYDIAFLGGGPHLLAAAGRAGQVCSAMFSFFWMHNTSDWKQGCIAPAMMH